jgi:hypothetical protein
MLACRITCELVVGNGRVHETIKSLENYKNKHFLGVNEEVEKNGL